MRGGAAIALGLLCAPVAAATPAGTDIVNTAALTFSADGKAAMLQSNTVSLLTATLIDVAVIADAAQLTVDPDKLNPVGFVVTNVGNASQDYAITVDGIDGATVASDSDGDGRYDPAIDQPLTGPLSLAPGQFRRLFVLAPGARIAAKARVSLTASSRIGSGAAGTIFPGAGVGGGDAVIGKNGGNGTAATDLVVRGTGARQPSLIKSQTVLAPDGSMRAVRGAIITYRLVASFPTATRGVAIDDRIPEGTAYVPGSLTLDDQALADAGDASAIRVALGDVAAGDARTIQFSVKIQ